MLTNKLQPKRVEIPHEPAEWMEFRSLSWTKFVEASEARQRAAIAMVAGIPADAYEKLGTGQGDQDEGAREEYDRGTVLIGSISAWSYEGPVTPENIGALDVDTAEWAYRTALEHSTRSKSEGEVSAPVSNVTTLVTEVGRES